MIGWEGYKWMMKLQKIKPRLKNWNKEVSGDLRLIEATLNNRLKELDSSEVSGDWTDKHRRERETLKRDLIDIMIKKEISISQKLKVQWAKEGDANSKLFHSLLNARNPKTSFQKLSGIMGEW